MLDLEAIQENVMMGNPRRHNDEVGEWVRAGQEPRKIVKAGWAAGETTGAKAMCLEWTLHGNVM